MSILKVIKAIVPKGIRGQNYRAKAVEAKVLVYNQLTKRDKFRG